jgi:hypothetical protein
MKLLRLGIGPGRILYQPGGIQPDVSGADALMALVSNNNNYAVHLSDITLSGVNVTLNGVQATAGVTRLLGSAGGAITVTLPITDRLVDALGPTVPIDGSFAVPISVQNEDPVNTATLVAGDANTTLNGTMTVQPGTRRIWLLTLIDKTHISIQNIGTFAVTSAAGLYVIACTFNGTFPASYVLLRHPFPVSVTFPLNLPDSKAVLDTTTLATAQTDIDIQQSTNNGTSYSSVGTMRFAINNPVATFIFSGSVTYNVGDIMRWVCPATPDATAGNFGGSLLGTR